MGNSSDKNSNSNEIFSYSPQGKKAEKKANKKKVPWKGIVAVLLSIITCLGGAGSLYYYTTLNSIGFADVGKNSNNVSGTTSAVGDYVISTANGDLLNDPMVLNVMLFGEDSVKDGETAGRSDTMLLMSIDNRHKKLKLTSFMRDMLVTIPGNNGAGSPYGLDKINASYTLGGADLTIKTVETNFGINIDRYAVVDFESFKSIIDVLGGVDIELTQDEIDYINWQTYLNGQSEERYEIQDEPGVVHLIGRQALWYARDRGYQDSEHPEVVISGDDFDRTTRQRKLIKTIMTRFKSASLTDIVSIVSQIGPMITTNLKKDEITTLVANSLTYLQYDEEENSLPLSDAYEYGWYLEQSVLMITNWDETRYKLAKFIYEDSVETNSLYFTYNDASSEETTQAATVGGDGSYVNGAGYEQGNQYYDGGGG